MWLRFYSSFDILWRLKLDHNGASVVKWRMEPTFVVLLCVIINIRRTTIIIELSRKKKLLKSKSEHNNFFSSLNNSRSFAYNNWHWLPHCERCLLDLCGMFGCEIPEISEHNLCGDVIWREIWAGSRACRRTSSIDTDRFTSNYSRVEFSHNISTQNDHMSNVRHCKQSHTTLDDVFWIFYSDKYVLIDAIPTSTSRDAILWTIFSLFELLFE